MATKQQTATKRAAAGGAKIAATNGRRLRFNKPAETDPKKRAEAVDRATSLIKTTARIDTISPGQEY